MTETRLRLAEMVASLSLITDLGLGQPLEHALRSAIVAVRLGDALGLGIEELRDAYYLTLLRFIGCTAAAHEMAGVLGDEVAARGWLTPAFTGRPEEMLQAVQENVGVGQPPPQREQTIARVLEGLVMLHGTGAAQCEVAQLLSLRLGLPASVTDGLGQVFERWDGLGVPHGIKAEDIQMGVQLAQLAQNAEMFWRRGGVEGAVAIVRHRASSAHDPRLVERFSALAAPLLADLDSPSIWEMALAAEPGRPLYLVGPEIDRAATAFADFADLKSPFALGHSRAVATLAADAAQAGGLPDVEVRTVRQAGWVHDIGQAGISAGIWEKPGPLATSEWERVRLHPYYTERALARSQALAGIGRVAGAHHERLDGSGYHRGAAAAQVSAAARILTAADAFQAMSEPRPYRPAYSTDYAAQSLQREVRAGRLDGDAVQAVLRAAGRAKGPSRRVWPASLTAREVEVLRLLARGLSDRQIGERLSVAERTAHHHVEHIYSKLAVSTRAAATLLAMEYDLLGETADSPNK